MSGRGLLLLLLVILLAWYAGVLGWLCLAVGCLLLLGCLLSVVFALVGKHTERRRQARADRRNKPDWAGPRPFAYLAQYSDKTCRRKTREVFDVDVEDEADEGATAEQERTFRQFVDHEEAICARVIDAVFRYYQEYRKVHGSDLDEEDAPPIDSPAGLNSLIEFDGLLVWRDELDGCCPLGFAFRCSWDPEHGLGVLVHEDVVVEVGQADASFSKGLSDESIWADVRSEEEARRAKRLEEVLDAKYFSTKPPETYRELLALIPRRLFDWLRGRSRGD